MKKHKSKKSVKKISSDGNPEVFVLSPEMLAKLGINIQTSQVTDTNLVTDIKQDLIQNSPTLQNGKPESSIIETASLMKESVFLSPTFNDSTSNVIPEVNEAIADDVSSPLITNNNMQYFNDTNITNDCLEEEIIPNSADNPSIECNDKQTEHTTNDLGPYESIEEYQVNNQDSSLVLTEVPSENTPNVELYNEEATRITPLKEHTDKSYILPDNVNDTTDDATEKIHCNVTESDSSNKIKIISEQVIFDLAQLKKITNIKLSNDANLIPINVDTIVTRKSVQNYSNSFKNVSPSEHFTVQKIVDQLTETDNSSEAEKVLSQKESQVLQENILHCNITDEPDFKPNHFETTVQMNGKLDIIKESQSIKAETEPTNITVINTKGTENLETVMSENILFEVKAYNGTDINPSEITSPTVPTYDINHRNSDEPSNTNILEVRNVNNCYKKRKYVLNISTEEQNINKKPSSDIIEKQSEVHRDRENPDREIDKVEEIALYLKQIANLRRKSIHDRKSMQKSTQEKVKELDDTQTEKDQHKIKFGKTYQKTSIYRQIPAPISIPQEYSDLFQLPKNFNLTNDNTDDIHRENMCLCYDFGNLSYYDCEMSYEHIHFWLNKNTNCDPKIVYGIYNDHIFVSEPTEFEDGNENLHEDDDTKRDNICWNELTTENNKSDEILSTSDINLTMCNETNVIEPLKNSNLGELAKMNNEIESIPNTIMKRKISLKSEEVNMHSVSEIIATVECGVCNKLILETEWETHKETEHDFLAWKAGENNIDFNNENLMLAISRRLKVVGILICPICNTKMKQLKKFTQHIEKCIKRKEVNPVTNTESSCPTRHTRRSIRNSTDKVDSVEFNDKSVTTTESSVTRPTRSSIRNSKIVDVVNDSYSDIHLSTEASSSSTTTQRDEKSVVTTEVSLPKLLMTDKKYSSKTKITSNMNSEILPKNIKLEKSDPFVPSVESFHSNESVENLVARTIVRNVQTTLQQDSGKDPKTSQQIVPIKERITYENDSTDGPRNDVSIESQIEIQGPVSDDSIQCGVCKIYIENQQWSDHLSKEHNYLAWRVGDRELNLKDDEQVKCHLKCILKQLGGLVCSKCGLTRKFVKLYLSHVKTCKGDELNDSTASGLNSTKENDNDDDEALSTIKSRKSRKRQSAPPQAAVVCGVCKTSVTEKLWIEHIQTKHKYLAWKDGDKPLDLNSEDDVKSHLNNIAKIHGLICNKCGVTWRYVKKYMLHDGICSSQEETGTSEFAEYVCGVCHEKGNLRDWRNHAMKIHYNIAWMADQTPINLKDPAAIDKCLKEYNLKYSFICNKCKTARASSHGFYAHIMTCGKTEEEIDAIRDECEICGDKYLCVYKNQHMSMHKDKQSRKRSKMSCDPDEDFVLESTENSVKRVKNRGSSDIVNVKQEILQKTQDGDEIEIEINPIMKCGVCQADVVAKDWIHHSQREHAYLAWIEGEEPLDTEDTDMVRKHLSRILNTMGELVCNKCGTSRKTEHGYRQHITACDHTGFKLEITVPVDLKKDEYECGVCNKRGLRKDFKEHAMNNHYNIAWIAGDLPINLRNFYAVEKYLKKYQAKCQLVCKVCKATRASAYGFYAHILQCGKSKEELEAFQNVCDICNNKYLCIYRSQHMTMHREQSYKNDLKILQKQKKAEEKMNRSLEEESVNQSPRKRKAAVKATGFIKKQSSAIFNVDGKSVCSCGATFSNQEELSNHKCRNEQESDASVKMEHDSSESDSDVDSNVSADEDSKKQRIKRPGEGVPRVARIPFRVDDYTEYLDVGYRDFCKLHYTTEVLFEEWRNTEYALVQPEEMEKYLPPLKESCKVRFGSGQWNTYKRFQSTKTQGVCMFTGGSIQCMCWVPARGEAHYLCVAAHRGGDAPRACGPNERAREPALLQIWALGDFTEAPRLAMAIALDYGIIWAVEWCPSGAREPAPAEQSPLVPAARLGLAAVACSDGGAYIFAVPYPSQHTELQNIVYKLKPIAELRISMSAARRIYQATSIHWSHQKGHKIIIVGYSDGTTALYDLNTESPLLRGNENGVHIFYPFEDKLSESTAITGTVLIPSSNPSHAAGGVCTSSVTGGTLRAASRAAPAARAHLPAAAAAPAPLWPALNLYSDAALTAKSVTELEYGGGRRLGSARCGAACNHCGRLAAACAPAVRILRAHPVYPDIKKLIIATLLMVPLNQKGKRKQVTDDLSMVVEPLTYDDAVSKYGLALSYVDRKYQHEAQKLCNENESRPERFPLSEIIACGFCPSPRYHEKLALATHAGLVFIINS